MIALLLAAALAAEPPTAEVGGDLKGFTTASFPYDNALIFGEDARPTGQSLLDARFKLDAQWGPVQFVGHHAITGITSGGVGFGLASSGVVFGTPETVKLSWQAFEDDAGFQLRGRTDRLYLKAGVPGVDVTLGRQPISFGNGLFFTPMDLVNPFTPAVIDQEYKPGVDALRVDGFFGMSGQITGVAAYGGEWDPSGMVFALYGQGTVGVTDVGGFAGYVYEDVVMGATTSTSIGAVGLISDVTVTLPPEGEDPFVRGTVGLLGQATPTTSISGEVYVQTLGSTDSSQALLALQGERYTRGELWLAGVAYGGLSVSQEIVPTLNASVATMVNLTDPSAFVAPNLVWSVDNNAEVVVGGFVGLGAKPENQTIADAIASGADLTTAEGQADALGARSEFGTYPATGFVQMKAYF